MTQFKIEGVEMSDERRYDDGIRQGPYRRPRPGPISPYDRHQPWNYRPPPPPRPTTEGWFLVGMLVIVFTLIFSVVLASFLMQENRDPPDDLDKRDMYLFCTISVAGDNYIIEILDAKAERLDEVSWSILNLNRLVTNWDDPSGEPLRMEGLLSDINFSQIDYNDADTKVYDKFYSRDPTGVPPMSRNHTLCIVYMDVNADGKLSSGDVIWMRSAENGGWADEDYRFRMVNERLGKAYGEKILMGV